MAVHVQVATLHSKQAVIEQKTSSLVILVQILDPLPLLEHLGFDTIPLSRVVNSKVNYKSIWKTHPSCLLVQESPHPIGNCGGIPHRSGQCIKGTIPQSRIDHPMMKEFVQNPLVSG